VTREVTGEATAADGHPPTHSRDATQARERILETSYRLFSRHGINAVGIDRIVAEARVAKMTLYRHFASKEELVLAFLELREQRWTHEWLQGEMERRASEPAARLLAAFDALGDWFQRRDYEGCAFLRTLMEVGSSRGAVRDAVVGHLATVHALLARFAREANARDPDRLSRDLQLLMLGAIASASDGDRTAAERARPLADAVIARALG
jgi:AcrR family transcriptional regulator